MSEVVKRSVSIRGHRTSLSLEDAFFDALHVLAARRGMSLARLIAQIDEERGKQCSLSSALRLYVLDAAKRGKLAEQGERQPTDLAPDDAAGRPLQQGS